MPKKNKKATKAAEQQATLVPELPQSTLDI